MVSEATQCARAFRGYSTTHVMSHEQGYGVNGIVYIGRIAGICLTLLARRYIWIRLCFDPV